MKIGLFLLFIAVAYEVIKRIYLNRKKLFPGMVKNSYSDLLTELYFPDILDQLENLKIKKEEKNNDEKTF